MMELLISLGVFIAFHIVPAIAPVRQALISVIGSKFYIVSYSLLSVALLVWVSLAYVNADTIQVWAQWPWTRWVPILVMPLSCLMLVSTLSEPNALSVGVKADRFDPTRPGIVSITRHPLIWALALWALAHLAPNGDTASLLLFGLFAVLALFGPWSLDRKKRREMGAEEWLRLTRATSSVPFGAIARGRGRLDWRGIGWWRALVAGVLYGVMVLCHEWAIGVSPFP